jgi:hypothetical protein
MHSVTGDFVRCCCLVTTLVLHPGATAARLSAAPVVPAAQRDLVLEDLREQAFSLSLSPRENARRVQLQNLEDQQVERCREERSAAAFDQCFYYDIARTLLPYGQPEAIDFGDARQPQPVRAVRRGPPTW